MSEFVIVKICMKGVCMCVSGQVGSNFGIGSASVYVLPTHCGSGLIQTVKEKKEKRTTEETKMVSFFILLKISTENVKSERKEK